MVLLLARPQQTQPKIRSRHQRDFCLDQRYCHRYVSTNMLTGTYTGTDDATINGATVDMTSGAMLDDTATTINTAMVAAGLISLLQVTVMVNWF